MYYNTVMWLFVPVVSMSPMIADHCRSLVCLICFLLGGGGMVGTGEMCIPFRQASCSGSSQLCRHSIERMRDVHQPCFGDMPAGCTQDCRFGLALCPTPAGGGSCSGVGWCLSTQGICQCYLGYAGDDCSLCDEGYVRCSSYSCSGRLH